MSVRGSDRACVGCLDGWQAVERRRPAASRGVAFWLVAFVLAITMLGTTLPTPLYVIYQAPVGFSSGVVTAIFAVYAAGVLAALQLAGRSSDEAGRRPVLTVALAFSALRTVAFILASGVQVLLVGWILSGLSAGLVTGTPTATLTELSAASASRRASQVATASNMGGLGLGPLVAGLFAQFAPHPTVLVFEVYLGVLAIAGLCLSLTPATVSPRRRPALRFARLGIPEVGRREFTAAGVAAFAALSLLGVFSALAPTFLGGELHEHDHAVAGGVEFLLFSVGTVAKLLLSDFRSRGVVMAGLGMFPGSLALILTALFEASLALFLAGTVVAGAAVSAVFLGSVATANRLAPAERRGQTISTLFVLCYAGLAIPVVGVGLASGFVGNLWAVLGFSILLAALSAFSLATIRRAL